MRDNPFADLQGPTPADLEKMTTVADFVAMLKGARVQSRKTLRSGAVTT